MLASYQLIRGRIEAVSLYHYITMLQFIDYDVTRLLNGLVVIFDYHDTSFLELENH